MLYKSQINLNKSILLPNDVSKNCWMSANGVDPDQMAHSAASGQSALISQACLPKYLGKIWYFSIFIQVNICSTNSEKVLLDILAQQRFGRACIFVQSDQNLHWVHYAKFPHAFKADSDQTVWVSRLIWIFTGSTSLKVCLMMLWPICPYFWNVLCYWTTVVFNRRFTT